MIKHTRYTLNLAGGDTLHIERFAGNVVLETRNADGSRQSTVAIPVTKETLIELHDAINEIEREVIGE